MLARIALAAALAHTVQASVEPFAADFKFVEPFGIVFDKAGNSYVIEYKGNRLIRFDPQGRSTILLTDKDVHEPHGVVISPDQRLYIADTHNNRVLRMDLKTRELTTVAGTGEAGFSGDGGPAAKAAFKGIFAIDLAPAGNKLYIADLTNRRVRIVDLKTNIVSTIAGNGESAEPKDGADAASSPLVDPRAVAADAKGNVYILERRGNALRVVDRAGKIRTLIKPGSIEPNLNGPKHLCIDRNGDVIIADAENHLVRRYSIKTGKTTTIAGTAKKGDRISAANPAETELARPHGVWVHPNGALYITDSYNHRILKVR